MTEEFVRLKPRARWRSMNEVKQEGFYLYSVEPELGNATVLYVGRNANGTMNMHGMKNSRVVCRGNRRARFYGPVPMDKEATHETGERRSRRRDSANSE